MIELKLNSTWQTQVLHELYVMSRYGKQLSIYTDLTKKQIEYSTKLCNYFNLSYMFMKPIGEDKKKPSIYVVNWEVFQLLRMFIEFGILNYNTVIFDDVIGSLCGINRCCRNNYIKFSEKDEKNGTINVAKDYLKKVNGKKDPYQIFIKNNMVHYGRHDELFNKINHIPCSPDCKYTAVQAKVWKEAWYAMLKKFNLNEELLKKEKEIVFKLR